MRIGLLWFDNDPKTSFADKVRAAVAAYQRKHGFPPNVCHAHPVPNLPEKVDAITITPDGYVLPQHLWLGVERST